VVSIIACIIAAALILPAVRKIQVLSRRDKCISHFYDLRAALDSYRTSNSASTYPSRLSELIDQGVPAADYVCPSSGALVGALSNVDLWTDYIYVVDLGGPHQITDIPILLCPPDNHYDVEGCLLYRGDGFVGCLWKFGFDRLLEQLYADTNLQIRVSEALTKRSKGRYRSRP